jgi:hypothetical protein
MSVSPNREQSAASLHPVQTSTVTSQTGASAAQPWIEHVGTPQWKSTHAWPWGHGRSSDRPRRPQSSGPRQQTPGTGVVEQAAASAAVSISIGSSQQCFMSPHLRGR